MKVYVNMKHNNKVETVDEFPFNNTQERRYAREMVNNYNDSDRSHYYYLSQRCTKEWREE